MKLKRKHQKRSENAPEEEDELARFSGEGGLIIPKCEEGVAEAGVEAAGRPGPIQMEKFGPQKSLLKSPLTNQY